jgi:hypothetical protein
LTNHLPCSSHPSPDPLCSNIHCNFFSASHSHSNLIFLFFSSLEADTSCSREIQALKGASRASPGCAPVAGVDRGELSLVAGSHDAQAPQPPLHFSGAHADPHDLTAGKPAAAARRSPHGRLQGDTPSLQGGPCRQEQRQRRL